MQKYTGQLMQPEHLITDGLLALSRNINYFGELLINAGFGLLPMHPLPLLILLVWVLVIWVPNMRRKDRSLSRYSDFEAYKERVRFFIPRLL